MNEEVSQLQSEIKQTRPFQSPAQEATVGLLRTASLLRCRAAAVVKPHGLTFSQYNVLRILRGAREPLPTMEIGERMIEKTPGITRLLDRLEKKGLACRERCAEDRRCVLCSITPEGLRLLETLDAPVSVLDEEVVGMLSREEQEQLVELLDAIRRSQN